MREQASARRRELLEGPPFALVDAVRGALRITAVNARARGGGVRVGQGLADARAVLPGLATRPAQPVRDHAGLVTLARWAGRYGPQRHVDGVDGVWIDATGVAHLYGGEERLAGDLYARLSRLGLTARIALAGTLGAAYALARFSTCAAQPVRCVEEGDTAAALAPLPVAALRVDAEMVLLARRLGLKRIGDLYGLPRTSLGRRFRSDRMAEALLERLDAALGHAGELRAGLAEPPRLSVERSFAEPLISMDGLVAAVGELTHELAALLAAQGLGLRRGQLVLSRADGSAAYVVIGTAAATGDGRHLLALLAPKLDTVDAGFGIDALRLEAMVAEPLAAQQTTLGMEHRGDSGGPVGAFVVTAERCTALEHLTDRLANRLGSNQVLVMAPAARHLPEHAVIERGALAQDRRRGLVPSSDPAFDSRHRIALRPALLLERPEPIAVMAEVPDGPPLRFTWRRVEHRVATAAGPERIAPVWWRSLPRLPGRCDEAEEEPAVAALGERAVRASVPRTRDYYQIEDREGGRYWVFREGLYGEGEQDEPPRWFLHGVFA